MSTDLDATILLVFVFWKILDEIYLNFKSFDHKIMYLIVLSIVGYIMLNC